MYFTSVPYNELIKQKLRREKSRPCLFPKHPRNERAAVQSILLTHSNSPNDFAAVSVDGHRHRGPGLAGRQRELAELGLLDPDLVVAVQSPAPEVLAPVGVLVVYHQQGEAAVLAPEAPAARRPRHGCAEDRGTLETTILRSWSSI